MKLFYSFFGGGKKNLYDTPEKLYEGLKAEATDAINVLIAKVTTYVRAEGSKCKLSETMMESIVWEAVMEHIEFLRSGGYEFRGICSSRHTNKIAYNLIRHTWSKRKEIRLDDGTAISDPAQPNASKNSASEFDEDAVTIGNHLRIVATDEREIYENREIIQKALAQLSEAEQNLLLQKYKEGYSDEELLANQTDTDYEEADQFKKPRERARYQFVYWWLYHMERLAPSDAPHFKKTKQARERVARIYLDPPQEGPNNNQRNQ